MKILEAITLGNCVLNKTPIVQEARQRIEKWDFIKFKSFCTSEETVIRIKRQNGNPHTLLMGM
jgi:hypothetical protein